MILISNKSCRLLLMWLVNIKISCQGFPPLLHLAMPHTRRKCCVQFSVEWFEQCWNVLLTCRSLLLDSSVIFGGVFFWIKTLNIPSEKTYVTALLCLSVFHVGLWRIGHRTSDFFFFTASRYNWNEINCIYLDCIV